uniref:Uncharacterized protein n=1 Tax=Anguilla anguilla TaxID=7936 RepID=A0A0E9QSE1_ANGAN
MRIAIVFCKSFEYFERMYIHFRVLGGLWDEVC